MKLIYKLAITSLLILSGYSYAQPGDPPPMPGQPMPAPHGRTYLYVQAPTLLPGMICENGKYIYDAQGRPHWACQAIIDQEHHVMHVAQHKVLPQWHPRNFVPHHP